MRKQPNRTAILFASFLHFDVSFLCWVMIGALGTFIVKDLHLSATHKGLLVAVPILGGSIARIFIGRIADSWSIKRTGYLTIIGGRTPVTFRSDSDGRHQSRAGVVLAAASALVRWGR